MIIKMYQNCFKQLFAMTPKIIYDHFKVGDGSRVFHWLDKWHPAGYLLDKFGYRIVYDSSIPLNAKLAAIIKDGDWFWSPVRSDDLVDIQSQLLLLR
jgi:hypothetical protein